MKKLFLILLLLFLIPLNCWAVTEFTCTVIPAGGGDYSSLSAWEAAINCNLTISSVTAGGLTRGAFADGVAITQTTTGATGTSLHDTTTQMLIITISGSPNSTDTWYPTADENDTTNAWTPSGSYDTARVTANCSGATADTTAVVIYGWTTNSTHYIQINGDNTTGKASTSHYRLSGISNSRVLSVAIDYVRLYNLELTNWSGNYEGLYISSSYVTVDSLIIHDTTNTYAGVATTAFSNNITITNSISYNLSGSQGFYLSGDTALSVKVYNCTAYNNATGFYSVLAYPLLKNCLSVGNSTADFGGPRQAGESDYNLSSDDTAVGAHSLKSSNLDPDASAATEFVSTSDLHLISTAYAINAGTDLSANFTTDIDGDTRTGTWDIGADEYVAPPSAQPVGYGVIFVY